MRVRSKSLSRARGVCAGGAGPLTVLRLLTLPAEPENDGSLTQRFPACPPGEGCRSAPGSASDVQADYHLVWMASIHPG